MLTWVRWAVAGVLVLITSSASANTINQNTSWKVTRSGATQTYRVVAYGDSIYAGYYGQLWSVARRAGPMVDGEYLSKSWGANIEIVRRTKSGAKADDIYHNKIVGERSYMQNTSTRVVMFEMCGNDFLQARSSFSGQTGTCSYAPLDTALASCSMYMDKAMSAINAYAPTAKLKVIANIYYPGYDADNVATSCKDATTGQPVNKQTKFLPYLAHSNWRACNLAAKYGFACADAFAEFMAAEYDSNGDGLVDTDGLRYVAGETEDAYVQRVTVTNRATIRDANFHFVNASTSFDYIQSDNTHPTYSGGTIGLNIFTSTGSGSGAPDYDTQIVGGKNPIWNRYGHEKLGWCSSIYHPATP
jgi:lysophospholipase L1-like esterase